MKKQLRLYNVLFPVWFLMLLPQLWLIILPGNFLIDSIVLLIAMHFLQIQDMKTLYKRKILPIFLYGLLADVIGALFLFGMLLLEVGTMGDELYITIPGMLISAGMIFVFHYFRIFRNEEKSLRLRLALTYTIATAPYTFLIPSRWIYGF